ncbi:MAG: sigma-70 family RNA polymerase sigma factor [Armatimonadetes bacterium]|nr:sigma-70 family RNA polymerase sigma factor [Armatimonadota bacterium]
MSGRLEYDLRLWGTSEQTLQELKKLVGERPEIVMAYHELLNPDTFDYCCQQVRAAISVIDGEDMEDCLVGMLASILYRLVTSPDEFTFEDRKAVRRYLRGAIRNVIRKLLRIRPLILRKDVVLARMSAVDITQQQEYLWLELQQVLSVLPPHQAVVMELYVRGYRIAEISARLQIPKGTVQSRLHRARQRLADA